MKREQWCKLQDGSRLRGKVEWEHRENTTEECILCINFGPVDGVMKLEEIDGLGKTS